MNAVETGLLSGFAHVLRPDASANNRDLGLTTARWRDLFLGRTLNIAQGIITADLKVLDLTATWNAGAVIFTAIKLNIVNTDSAAGSLLVDLQVGGDSKFKVDKTGQVTTAGAVVLPANPTVALQAATKQYADLMLPLAGGVSMTGLFNLSGNPTTALQAATKQYVDALGSGADSPFRVIRGRIDTTAPTILQGVGFTVAKFAVGDVIITFSTAFGGVPAVVAIVDRDVGGSARFIVLQAAPTTTTARIGRFDAADVQIDGTIDFIAIGPR